MALSSIKVVRDDKDYENPSPGTEVAVIVGLADEGSHMESYQGGPEKLTRKLRIFFELAEKMKDGRPFRVHRQYTNSLHEKSRLRQHLESWSGKSITASEFNLTRVLGKPCMLSLIENEKGYVNVGNILALPKSTPPLEPVGDLMLFDLDEPDWVAYEQLPQWLRDKIAESPEYRAAKGQTVTSDAPTGGAAQYKPPVQQIRSVPQPAPEAAPVNDLDDDLPF